MNIEKCLPHFAIESDLFIFTIMIDIIILWDKIWEVGGAAVPIPVGGNKIDMGAAAPTPQL